MSHAVESSGFVSLVSAAILILLFFVYPSPLVDFQNGCSGAVGRYACYWAASLNCIDVRFPEGVDYLTFETLDSTNAQARRVLGQGRDVALFRSWIIADTQTAGRGRMGRTWSSPVGNLMATYVCAPECERHQLAEIGFCRRVGAPEYRRPHR